MKKLTTLMGIAVITIMLASTAWGQVNYNFAVGSTTYTALAGASAFTWTTTIANDEEYSTATNIGFTFTYCGTAFTQFQVSTNGFMRMGTGLASATLSDSLGGLLRGVLAPLWNDLAVSATATDITYLLSGSPETHVLTVEWNNVKWNKTAAAANAQFQVKLFEADSHIEFIYGTMGTPTSGSASIGLSDNTVTTGGSIATGKFLSINVGGAASARVYHQSMGFAFNGINNAPDNNTKLTFTPVTPAAIAGGTYTIGGTTPTYASLSDAAMALNINGISGPVVLNVRTGTFDDIFHLLAVSGQSSTNTITLQKESGAVTLSPRNGSQTTTAPSITTGDAIVRLDGAQFVTIDGINLADNSSNASTATKFEVGIMMATPQMNAAQTGAARFNTVKNLSIDMKNTNGAANAGAVGIRFGTQSGSDPDTTRSISYNFIKSVTITGFWRAAIKTFGISGTNPDVGNTIQGCTIGDVNITSGTSLSDIRALELDVQKNMLIENNEIRNITSDQLTTNSIYGIWFNPASSATGVNSGTMVIRNNSIYNLANSNAAGTSGFAVGFSSNNVANNTEFQIYNDKIYNIYANGSTTSRAYGIGLFMSTGLPTTAKIYNNIIFDIRAPRSTGTPGVRGIDLQNGAGSATFLVYYNTVTLDDATPPTAATQRSACLNGATLSTASIDLRNNIFINLQSTLTGPSPVIYMSANTNLLRLATVTDYNLYYAGTPSAAKPIAYDAASTFNALSDYQTAVASGGLGGPRDVHAISQVVTFVSSTDLHLGGSNGDVQLTGTPVGGYTTDIDGDTRSVTAPYMGADEASTPLPVELTSFTAAFHGRGIDLSWATASESNNYGFEVERRRVSSEQLTVNNWNKVAFVEGRGTTSTPQNYSFRDNSATAGKYSYRLKQIDRDGKFSYSNEVEATVALTPADYTLSQNYPNPFNPSTTIRFAIRSAGLVSLKVYNAVGQEVRTLFNGAAEPDRVYAVLFDGTGLASGTYFYVLQTPASREVKKMLMVK